MPEDKPDLTDQAHKVATEAVDAVEAFTKAAATLPADVARLALNTLQAAVDKAKDVVNKASK